MRKKSARSGTLATFKYPFTVEVRAAEFRAHPLLSMVDRTKLSNGNHKVEIGSAHGGCCPRRVFATVRKGMVIGLDVEPCKDGGRLSKHALAVVREAYKRARRTSARRWKPIPVRDFFTSTATVQRLVISWGGWCVQVCWDSGTDRTMTCVRCCISLSTLLSCTIDTIFTGL